MATKNAMKVNSKVCSEHILFYNKCSCGAITIETSEGIYSCEASLFEILFPNVDLRQCEAVKELKDWFDCNHCKNKIGLDLCSCGSGKRVGEYSCGSMKSMQEYGKYEVIIDGKELRII